MPNWISNGGKWVPAKEEVGLTNHSDKSITVNGKTIAAGKPYIYEGPDRGALYQLWEESGKPSDPKKAMTYLGKHYKDDPDFIGLIRQKYGMTIDEYLKMIGFDEKAAEEEFKKIAAEVKSHEVVARGKEIEYNGGGIEHGTGKVIMKGAIGDVAMPV